MKNLLCINVLFLLFVIPEKKQVKIFLAGDSTMAIKQRTAFPETGWGMPFTLFWDSSVTVVNIAKNGRSTKTFISEGLWKSIYDDAGEGDYTFIQFGHNDESPEKKDRYSPPDSFKLNLMKFIDDSRIRKAIPVLITPVGRRKFDSAGRVMETHLVYAALTREVAGQKNVVLIDLDRKSQQLYQDFGDEHSRLLFLHLKPGEHPNYPGGKEDNTHFNELGARLIAQLVLAEIESKIPGLAVQIFKPESK